MESNSESDSVERNSDSNSNSNYGNSNSNTGNSNSIPIPVRLGKANSIPIPILELELELASNSNSGPELAPALVIMSHNSKIHIFGTLIKRLDVIRHTTTTVCTTIYAQNYVNKTYKLYTVHYTIRTVQISIALALNRNVFCCISVWYKINFHLFTYTN